MMVFITYVLASVTVAWIAPLLFSPMSLGVPRLLRHNTAMILVAVIDLVQQFISVLLVVWLCQILGVEARLLMILIPVFFLTWNSFHRIGRASRGITSAYLLAQENEQYDQAKGVAIEWWHLTGDVLGWGIGILYFMPGAGFV
ncbi:hypothetical protein MYX82_13375 [Acidobacteria bacterium AH-259-D05]|nr:hypothetical protein [Acidobacteria bacterium AH-259-D05]